MRNAASLVAKFIVHRKLRTFLTTLGIAVGVMLVFSISSLNQGTMAALTRSLGKIGGNLVTITPKLSSFPGSSLSFSDRELEAVRNEYFVKSAMGVASSSFMVKIREEEYFMSVTGMDPKDRQEILGEMSGYSVDSGRDLKSSDEHVVVVGNKLAEDQNLRPGSQIEISGELFRVIGVFEKIGNPQRDNSITINIRDLWDLTGSEGEYTIIMVIVSEMKKEELIDDLERIRGRNDFEVSTTEDLLKTINSVLNVVNIVFSAIAGVSILIGAINVSNTMYMAVSERTRDIGIMKAIGAKNSDILFLFLVESGFLSLIGGLFGAVLGYGLASLFAYAGSALTGIENLSPMISFELVGVTATFSFLVGVISGVYPARHASKLQPTEALRYE